MLDSFCVDLRLGFFDTDREEEREHDLVTLTALVREGLSRFGQEDRFAWFFGEQAFFSEAVDDSSDGDMGDSHAVGEIPNAGGAGLFDELGDCFGVVLGCLVAVRGAGGLETVGLGDVGLRLVHDRSCVCESFGGWLIGLNCRGSSVIAQVIEDVLCRSGV